MNFELPKKLQDLHNQLQSLRREEKLFLQNGDTGFASAPSNIALIKYWGKQPSKHQIPVNESLSFTLGGFRSHTQVIVRGRFRREDERGSESAFEHQVALGKDAHPETAPGKMQTFLNNLLHGWGDEIRFQIRSQNNFPTACGIASSASGYAALVGAVADLCQLQKHFSAQDLQYWLCEWARLGSGSATRSACLEGAPDFVSWEFESPRSTETKTLPVEAHELFATLKHCVIVVDGDPKRVSSSEGHTLAHTSPLQSIRCAGIGKRHSALKEALKVGDFLQVASLTERDAFDMHAVMQTGSNPVNYLKPLTVELIADFVTRRDSTGARAFWTLDAGPNPHILFLPEATPFVQNWIEQMNERAGVSLKLLAGTLRCGLIIGKSDTGKLAQSETVRAALSSDADTVWDSFQKDAK